MLAGSYWEYLVRKKNPDPLGQFSPFVPWPKQTQIYIIFCLRGYGGMLENKNYKSGRSVQTSYQVDALLRL